MKTKVLVDQFRYANSYDIAINNLLNKQRLYFPEVSGNKKKYKSLHLIMPESSTKQ